MSEITTDTERTADGEPLVDRGTADSARASVTEPDEENGDELEDDEDDEEEEDV